MAEAIIAGLLREGVAKPDSVLVSEIVEARRLDLQTKHGVGVVASNVDAVAQGDIVILAVKPQNLVEVMAEIKGRLPASKSVLSIVAGAKIGTLNRGLATGVVMRAMPNTPGQIGQGITVWTATNTVSKEHKELARRILKALGQEVYVPEEKYIDMATALSASGPAYVFLFIESLIDAGVYMGMSRDMARKLALQTVLGSALMVQETGKHPAELRDMVTSPGGTTAEALLSLEQSGFRAAIIEAVAAAYEKALLLGEKD